MRHQNKGFKLGRTASHRKATLAAMSNALIRHKKITTTLTKARALRMYVEPLINRSKQDTMNNRRQAFRHLQDKAAVTELFSEIAERIGDRPGGYTRVIKLGQRAGDSAEMAVIELVDYNDVKPFGSSDSKKKRTRRGARKRSGVSATSAAVVADAVDDAAVEIADDPEEVAGAEVAVASDVEEAAAIEKAVVEEAGIVVEASEEVEEPAVEAEAVVDEAVGAEVEEPAAEAEAVVDEAVGAEVEEPVAEGDTDHAAADDAHAASAEADGDSTEDSPEESAEDSGKKDS